MELSMPSSNAAKRQVAASRADFPVSVDITTRWMDNDVYGHVNNVVYYSFFDTAINQFLIDQDFLDPRNGEVVGFVVETGCQYFRPISFPDRVAAGIRVKHLGRSSVRYEVGIFCNEDETASAQGHFVHVYVARGTKQPVAALPESLRHALGPLLVDDAGGSLATGEP
jgi:acyl-CoA thioester hydrolase